MPDVNIEHLYKSYGSVAVLEDLQLSINDGDFLVLLGPSGCGKSTLLNLIAGLEEVTSGRIMIGGNDVTELEPKDRGLAMVFQSYALYPTKTVEGNLRFGLSSSGLSKTEIESRIHWASEILHLKNLMKRKPSALSGGQRQRVAIGRALVKHADVLLFDEPLSNLDAKLRTEMRMEIKKLHEVLEPTVIYVTHDQIEAMTMATKIAIMHKGEIQQFGSPDEIYEKPYNLFVADFIGSPSMNLLEATLMDKTTARLKDHDVLINIESYSFSENIDDNHEVIIGFRPEHFGLNIQNDVAVDFYLPVEYVERTGSDTTVSFVCGSKKILARFNPEVAYGFHKNQELKIQYPKSKLNIFDKKTTIRL